VVTHAGGSPSDLEGIWTELLSTPRSFVGFVIPGLAGRLEGLLGTFVYGHCISHNEVDQALEPSRARFGFDRIDDGFSIRMKIRHGSCLDDRYDFAMSACMLREL